MQAVNGVDSVASASEYIPNDLLTPLTDKAAYEVR